MITVSIIFTLVIVIMYRRKYEFHTKYATMRVVVSVTSPPQSINFKSYVVGDSCGIYWV